MIVASEKAVITSPETAEADTGKALNSRNSCETSGVECQSDVIESGTTRGGDKLSCELNILREILPTLPDVALQTFHLHLSSRDPLPLLLDVCDAPAERPYIACVLSKCNGDVLTTLHELVATDERHACTIALFVLCLQVDRVLCNSNDVTVADQSSDDTSSTYCCSCAASPSLSFSALCLQRVDDRLLNQHLLQLLQTFESRNDLVKCSSRIKESEGAATITLSPALLQKLTLPSRGNKRDVVVKLIITVDIMP